MHPQGFVYCLRVAHPTSVSLLYFEISFRMSREHNQLEKQRETEEQKQFTWSFKFIKNGLARLTLRYKCIPCFRGIFRHFFSLWLSRTSHLFPLENNTIHTCIKRAFVRYFHAIQETIYISKIKKSVMNIKIKTVSNFLHLIILHIGAHITRKQIKGVVWTTIGSLCFPLVWLFCDRGIFFFISSMQHYEHLSRDTCKFWRGPGSCYWMTRMFWWIVHLLSVIDFFGRAEIFVGILTINGKIVSVLNLKKKDTQNGSVICRCW